MDSKVKTNHFIRCEERDGKITLHISGKLIFEVQAEFRAAYESIDTKKRDCRNFEILISLAQVEYIDSSGLGMLLVMRKYLLSKSIHFQIINSRGQSDDLLRLTHFDRYFRINGNPLARSKLP